MIPSPWIAVVLTLGAYRVTRLIGWDDLPPVVKARRWVTGAVMTRTGSSNALKGLTSEEPDEDITFRRPTLAHFIQCPFCQGFWTSVVVYVWWMLEPTSCLYTMAAFALAGAVGLISKNLDP